MPRPSSGPLTDQHYAQLNKSLAQIAMVQRELEKATQAGLPCDELDQACQAKQELLTRIKKTYFPDRT